MLLISIPKPCHEDWNKMLPSGQGAFCNVCSKTVVDFTSLSDEEVKNYFLSKQGQKTCGRFKNTQLSNNENILPTVLAGNLPLWKKFLAIVVVLFGSFLTACKEEVVGKIALPEIEARKKITNVGITLIDMKCEIEMGEPVVEELHTTKGFISPIIIENPVPVGDIKMEQIDFLLPTLESPKIDTSKKNKLIKDSCENTKLAHLNI